MCAFSKTLFGLLKLGAIDMVSYDMTITEQRLQIAKFSTPVDYSTTAIFLGDYNSLSISRGISITPALFVPFDLDLWLITSAVLVITLILELIRPKRFLHGIFDWTIACGLVLAYLYSCNLKAQAVSAKNIEFQDLQGFANMVANNKYKILIETTEDFRFELMRSSKLPSLRALSLAVQQNPPMIKQGVSTICNFLMSHQTPKVAYIQSIGSFLKWFHRQKGCLDLLNFVKIIDAGLPEQKSAFMISKKTDPAFLEQVNRITASIRAMKELKYRRLLNERKLYQTDRSKLLRPMYLGLNDLFSIFAVLYCGALIGSLTLLAELGTVEFAFNPISDNAITLLVRHLFAMSVTK